MGVDGGRLTQSLTRSFLVDDGLFQTVYEAYLDSRGVFVDQSQRVSKDAISMSRNGQARHQGGWRPHGQMQSETAAVVTSTQPKMEATQENAKASSTWHECDEYAQGHSSRLLS
jgi:hypothetical protein